MFDYDYAFLKEAYKMYLYKMDQKEVKKGRIEIYLHHQQCLLTSDPLSFPGF